MKNTHSLEVTKEFFIPAPPNQVWRFLMSEEKMKTWLHADEFVIDMSDGGKIEFPLTFGEDEYLILGEFSILLFEKKYAFVWRERDALGDEWFNCTTVSFDLEKKENGTLLNLVHTGFKYLPPEVQHQIHARYLDFWVRGDILDRLVSLVITD
jgi:uncharacterized protein YndB with AHSA1/START domain